MYFDCYTLTMTCYLDSCFVIIFFPLSTVCLYFSQNYPPFTPVFHPSASPQCFTPLFHPSVSPQCFAPVFHPSVSPQCLTPVFHPNVSPQCFTRSFMLYTSDVITSQSLINIRSILYRDYTYDSPMISPRLHYESSSKDVYRAAG